MLRTKRLLILICLTVVTFCFAGTVPAKACGDWDFLLDCYMDSNGDIWMLWWNWHDRSLRWVCLEDLWPSDATQSTYAGRLSGEPGMAVAADRNPFITSPMAEAKNISLFVVDSGREGIKGGNANQHQEDGQNVLFLDSHVGFMGKQGKHIATVDIELSTGQNSYR